MWKTILIVGVLFIVLLATGAFLQKITAPKKSLVTDGIVTPTGESSTPTPTTAVIKSIDRSRIHFDDD